MDLKIDQRGQIGVIILLIMVVLLTIGLSLASRSSEDLFLAQQQSESTRVFNAAEAGIEEALSTALEFTGEAQDGSIDNFNNLDIDVDYTVRKVDRLETRLFEMVSVLVDVTGVADGQGITVNWSHEDNCGSENVASVIAMVYYDDAGTTRVRNYALGGCDRGDGYTLASDVAVDSYNRQASVPLQAGDLFVRVRSIYNDTHIRITGDGWTLPTQYLNVRSEAASNVGNETRIVEVNRTLATAPSVLDFALFSGSTIIK